MNEVCFPSHSNRIYQLTEEHREMNIEEISLFFLKIRIDILCTCTIRSEKLLLFLCLEWI